MFSFLELFVLTSLSSSVSAGPSIYKTLPFDNYMQLFFFYKYLQTLSRLEATLIKIIRLMSNKKRILTHIKRADFFQPFIRIVVIVVIVLYALLVL